MAKFKNEHEVEFSEPPVKSVVKETSNDGVPPDQTNSEVSKEELLNGLIGAGTRLENDPKINAENAPEHKPEVVPPLTGMRKHPLNIVPDATSEQYASVKKSITERGFDNNFPIVVCWDGTMTGDSKNYHLIIDGWTRWKVCQELDIIPKYKHFDGSDKQLLELCVNSNARKTYTTDQWACICTLYKIRNAEILATEAKERKIEGNIKGGKRGRPKKSTLETTDKNNESKSTHENGETKSDDKHKGETNQRIIAELGAVTNRNKVRETDKLIDENRLDFDKVYNGSIKLKDIEVANKSKKPSKKPKAKGNGHGSDALYVIKTTKDLWSEVRTARKYLRDEEVKLAPATKAVDDFVEANKANIGADEDVSAFIEERDRLKEIEGKILERIQDIKDGLADSITEKIDE
jgi:hypothetical protein